MPKISLLIKWARLRMAMKLFPSGNWGACSNRTWREVRMGGRLFELIVTDEREPSTYSREEVYSFLKIVRAEEKRTGWTCPEPEGDI